MNTNLRHKLVDECNQVGVQYKDIPEDGEWHRTDLVSDPRGKGDGTIKIFRDGNGGIIKNWKTGESRLVFADSKPSENWGIEIRRDVIPSGGESQNNDELIDKASVAANRANQIWNTASPASPDHPYLINKKIDPCGVRQYRGFLIIPVIGDGEIQSLQFIAGDGKKTFLKKGRITGGYYMIQENKECTM
jgi:putative DNA primase/helicase